MKSKSLFELIKSLSKSEKRFFKIYALGYSSDCKKNYLMLFEIIDKLKEYDAIKLQEKVKNASFTGDIRGIKNYLYILILDCLDFYHKNSSIDSKISKYINISRVLSDKGLDGQSNKIIKKAWQLSEEHMRFENIIALNSLWKAIGFNKETISCEDIQTYYKKNFTALACIKEKLEYNKIYDELLLKRRQLGLITDPQEKSLHLKPICDNPFFNIAPDGSSFDANLFYLLSKVEYNRLLTDTKTGAIYIRKLVTLFDEHTNRIADNIDHYVYILHAFISERVFGNNREEADAMLNKLTSIPTLIGEKNSCFHTQAQIFQVYYVLYTHIALIFRDYEHAIPQIKKYDAERKKYENNFIPSFRLCIQSNIACIYFGAGYYKLALRACNEAMTNLPKIRDDIRYVLQTLYVLIHVELGNEDIFSSLKKSMNNNRKKRKPQFITVLFKYLTLLFRSESIAEKNLILLQLKKEVLLLIENPLENHIFDDIDMIAWIDKKLIPTT